MNNKEETRVIARNRIVVREKGPLPNTHIIEFTTPEEARKAFNNAQAFWSKSGHIAVLVENKFHSIIISSDIVGSVSLCTGPSDKKAKAKK